MSKKSSKTNIYVDKKDAEVELQINANWLLLVEGLVRGNQLSLHKTEFICMFIDRVICIASY